MAHKSKNATPSPQVAYPPTDPAPTLAAGESSLYEVYSVGPLPPPAVEVGVRGSGAPFPTEYLFFSSPPVTDGGQALYQFTASGWVLKKAECRPGFAAGPPPSSPGQFPGEIRRVPCVRAVLLGRPETGGPVTDLAAE